MSPGPEGAIESCGCDPAADRWAIAIWGVTADLFACAYAYAEEGGYDGSGRWRRQRLRHYLAGTAADRVRALAQAAHFCALIRQLARAHGKTRGGTAHVRRSFEHGCSDRLVARLRAEAAAWRLSQEGPARRGAEAEAARHLRMAGLVPRAFLARPDRSDDDRSAGRHGKAAADNISLVLRTGAAAPEPTPGEPQLTMF